MRAAEEETIAAIATPRGEGGIGIVRVSGRDSLSVVGRIFRGARAVTVEDMEGYSAQYGWVHAPATGEFVDEAVVLVMRAPRSYTREDVAEVQVHGGWIPLQRTLELALENGARLAEPGEFTKRAFLNGRLDLAQAEAVMEIVRARTPKGLGLAVQQLGGGVSRLINEARREVISVLGALEAAVDFPEEDVPEGEVDGVKREVESLVDKLDRLLERAEKGRVFREGVRTLIAGKVNVGKSSLLNALVEQERVLVTDVPGTTRDAVEEVINLGGVPLRLIDTAGIRAGGDRIEQMGMEYTRRYLQEAELVLAVIDGHEGLSAEDEEIGRLLRGKNQVVAINKADLGVTIELSDIRELFPGAPVVQLSAKTGWGLEALEKVVKEVVVGDASEGQDTEAMVSLRHRDCLERARQQLQAAAEALEMGAEVDLAAVDMREALETLGEITGDTASESLLDHIFREFCIGK